MKKLTLREEMLQDYLEQICPGRRSRKSGAELGQELHISATDLRKLVNRLRQKGKPIGSDQRGYFYAQTAGEVYSTIQSLKRMRTGLDAAIQGLERSLDEFPRGR